MNDVRGQEAQRGQIYPIRTYVHSIPLVRVGLYLTPLTPVTPGCGCPTPLPNAQERAPQRTNTVTVDGGFGVPHAQ
jgi:hypothetical protein